MLLSARPLRATARDLDGYFVGRGEALERVRAACAEYGLNVLVHGDRGSGRTTFLHAVERALRETNEVTYLECRSLTAADVVARLGERVAGPERVLVDDPEADLVHVAWGRPPRQVETRWSDGGQTLERLERIGLRIRHEESPHVFLLDGLTVSAARSLFGRLRDEVWNVPALWVASVATGDLSAVLEPPADAFFETVVPLEPLSDAEAHDLVLRRLGDAGSAIDARTQRGIVGAGAGNPRELVAAARVAVTEGVDRLDALARSRGALAQRLAEMGAPAVNLADAMRSRGPVSASDESLQRTLGWSRSRISQVLSELAAKGLVTTSPAAHEPGQNRRRKLYALHSELDHS